MLSMFPLYIFLFIFDISFFLSDHNGNKAVQLCCAINLYILHGDEINLPTYLPTYLSTCLPTQYLQNLKYNVKQEFICYLILFGGISSNLILSVKNAQDPWVGFGVYFNRQNHYQYNCEWLCSVHISSGEVKLIVGANFTLFN